MENKIIKVAGKEYEASPLRMKHLKRLTEMMNEPRPKDIYSVLSRWFPFIFASISDLNSEFKSEQVDEMTSQEVNDAVVVIAELSGIKMVSSGETMPVE